MQDSPLNTASNILSILTFVTVVVAIVVFSRANLLKHGDTINAQIADITMTAAQYVSEAGAILASPQGAHDSEEGSDSVDDLLQRVYESALGLSDLLRQFTAASRFRWLSLWPASQATLLRHLRDMQDAIGQARRLRFEARIDDLHKHIGELHASIMTSYAQAGSIHNTNHDYSRAVVDKFMGKRRPSNARELSSQIFQLAKLRYRDAQREQGRTVHHQFYTLTCHEDLSRSLRDAAGILAAGEGRK